MLVIGKYELATNPLKQMEQYSLNFADNEQLLDYVLDANLQEGYVISQREGEQRLYQWKRGESSALTYLTTLPDSIQLTEIALTEEQKLKITSLNRIYVYNEANNLVEDGLQEVREYIVEKFKQDIDSAMNEDQLTQITSF